MHLEALPCVSGPTCVLLLLGSGILSGLVHNLHALRLHVLLEDEGNRVQAILDAVEESVHPRQMLFLHIMTALCLDAINSELLHLAQALCTWDST